MVQRYPSSDKPLEGERPEAPPPVQNAVKLMYVGAAISTVSLIISLALVGGLKSTIRKQYPSWTASQVNQEFRNLILISIIFAGIGIALWLWMARASSQGKNWARITSSVLFVLGTFNVAGSLRGPKNAIDLVFPILTWLVGLGAIWFLWRPESTAFFKRPVYR